MLYRDTRLYGEVRRRQATTDSVVSVDQEHLPSDISTSLPMGAFTTTYVSPVITTESGGILTTSLNYNISATSGATASATSSTIMDASTYTQPMNTTTLVTSSAVGSASTPTSAGASSGGKSSTGAIAGAAVGGAFGGLLIGFLAAFLFFRWRKARSPSPVAYAAPPPEPKRYPQSSVTPTPPPDTPQLSQYLLDALSDSDLASELRSSGQLIEAHSERNYHFEPIQANLWDLSQALTNLGVGEHGSLSVDDIIALVLNPQTRQTAIRHVLARVLYTSIDFGSRSRLTMLPAPIAAFLQSIPPVERNGGSKDAYSAALSRWRVLGAFLLHPQRSMRVPLTPNGIAIAPQAASLVNALNTFLDPFVPGSLKQQQANHLQLVIMECAKFGYILFSQPNDWRLTLSPGNTHRMAVVCAGLEKTSNQNGHPHAFPHSVLAPSLVQV